MFYLFFLFLKLSHSTISNSSYPIVNSCIIYFKDLSIDFSEFTQCITNYSRPFHACQNCVDYYLKLNKTRNLILNVNFILNKCKITYLLVSNGMPY